MKLRILLKAFNYIFVTAFHVFSLNWRAKSLMPQTGYESQAVLRDALTLCSHFDSKVTGSLSPSQEPEARGCVYC